MIHFIAAITPLIPLFTKAIEAKKGNSIKDAVVKTALKSSGVTEVSQIGYASALTLIAMDMLACGDVGLQSIQCVTQEHWGALAVSLSLVLANALRKKKES